jgi:adenylate kinase family enzyme
MTERSIARAEAAKKEGKERVDDNPVTIAKRVKDFRKKNKPVEIHVKEHGPFQEVSYLREGHRISLIY